MHTLTFTYTNSTSHAHYYSARHSPFSRPLSFHFSRRKSHKWQRATAAAATPAILRPCCSIPIVANIKNSVAISNGNYLALNCSAREIHSSSVCVCECAKCTWCRVELVSGELHTLHFARMYRIIKLMLFHPFNTISKIIPRRWHRQALTAHQRRAQSTYDLLVKCDFRRVNETVTTNYLAPAGSIYWLSLSSHSHPNKWTVMTLMTPTTRRIIWFRAKMIFITMIIINIATSILRSHEDNTPFTDASHTHLHNAAK